MKICVLNGSPRGQYSTTLQTGLYLQKRYPQHEFAFVEVGSRISSLEKDISPALTAMQSADLIIFSYPVYTFLAPSQLHRFIAALKAGKADLRGKWATQITTSKHFYDVTAHRYIEDNCRDLGLRVIRGLSADMEDLLTEKGRRDAEEFPRVRHLVRGERRLRTCARAAKRPARLPAPSRSRRWPKTDGHDVAVVADLREGDESAPGDDRSLYRRLSGENAPCQYRRLSLQRRLPRLLSLRGRRQMRLSRRLRRLFCARRSRRRTPSSTPSPCATTPWARPLRPTTIASSATATAPSPRARPWATS